MTTKYMTYVQVNATTIETEKNDCKWRKRGSIQVHRFLWEFLSGNIQKAAKYIGLKVKRKVRNRYL